jgi:hypothetical protein
MFLPLRGIVSPARRIRARLLIPANTAAATTGPVRRCVTHSVRLFPHQSTGAQCALAPATPAHWTPRSPHRRQASAVTLSIDLLLSAGFVTLVAQVGFMVAQIFTETPWLPRVVRHERVYRVRHMA